MKMENTKLEQSIFFQILHEPLLPTESLMVSWPKGPPTPAPFQHCKHKIVWKNYKIHSSCFD